MLRDDCTGVVNRVQEVMARVPQFYNCGESCLVTEALDLNC
jgi:hypothetical protein